MVRKPLLGLYNELRDNQCQITFWVMATKVTFRTKAHKFIGNSRIATFSIFTITGQILARWLAYFYCQLRFCQTFQHRFNAVFLMRPELPHKTSQEVFNEELLMRKIYRLRRKKPLQPESEKMRMFNLLRIHLIHKSLINGGTRGRVWVEYMKARRVRLRLRTKAKKSMANWSSIC